MAFSSGASAVAGFFAGIKYGVIMKLLVSALEPSSNIHLTRSFKICEKI